MGDPNGIGPELTAKLVAEKETSGKAHLIIIADQQVLDEGMKVAGVNFNYRIADITVNTNYIITLKMSISNEERNCTI